MVCPKRSVRRGDHFEVCMLVYPGTSPGCPPPPATPHPPQMFRGCRWLHLGTPYDAICVCSPLCVSSSKRHPSSRMPPTVDTVHQGVRPYVCTAASMSPGSRVALQVTTSPRFKIWGYALHGAQPRMLERRSVHGARPAPSLEQDTHGKKVWRSLTTPGRGCR